MSLDFSQKTDLLPLARVAGALNAIAAPIGIEFFLMGAAARDLWLLHAYRIEPTRLTEDVDFAVMVHDWAMFEALRVALIASGNFTPRPGPATHRLRHLSGLPIDIVPFGGVERADRTIAWPPDQAEIFDCFGASEALNASVLILLPQNVQLRVAPIAALAMLKVIAWQDRKHTHPGRDAPDLLQYVRNYLDCGNLGRATSDHADLFAVESFDYQLAGARLLARDTAKLLDGAGINRLLQILLPEADERGARLLAHQSGIDEEAARQLIEAFCDELAGAL